MRDAIADLEVRTGPGLLTAALDAAARADLHPRRLTLPPRGDELSLLSVIAEALTADTARLRVHLRHRAFVGWTEQSRDGDVRVDVRLRVFDQALRVQRPRLDAASVGLLTAWGVEAGTPQLPELVVDALERAWSPPVPLASVRFDPGPDGVLRRDGTGRRKPQAPPPPPPGDLVATASVAGLLRLLAARGRASFRGGVAEAGGVRVWADGVALHVSGDDPPRVVQALAAPIELVRLTRHADALHDEHVSVHLVPSLAALDDDGLRLAWHARVARSRHPHPVTLTGVVHRGDAVQAVLLKPADGPAVEMTVARARAALANRALQPATASAALQLDATTRDLLGHLGLLVTAPA